MKAILTGHSRGLGAAIAADLLSRNVRVLGLSRTRNGDLAGRFPDLLEQAELDLSDTAALAGWLGRGAAEDFLSGCEAVLLINNAGLVQPMGPAGAQDPLAIARAVGVNVAAPMMLASAFVAASRVCPDRRIVHLSSGAAHKAYAGWSVYCASKAALDHHARAVALDRIPALRICSVAPGVVDTDMQSEVRAATPEQFPLRDRFIALKQAGELAAPEDAARRFVDHLLSDEFGRVPVTDLRELAG